MSKFRAILLLITFAAAAWATAQVVSTDPVTSQPEASVRAFYAPLTEGQREQVVTFLKTEQPDLFRKLEDVRAAAPQKHTVLLNQVGRQTLYLIDIQQSNPDLYAFYKEEAKVAREVERLRGQIGANTDPARESELVAELREQLNARFDLVQSRQELLVTQARKTVERTDTALRSRIANKQSIVDRELELLVNAAKGKSAPATPITVSAPLRPATTPATRSDK